MIILELVVLAGVGFLSVREPLKKKWWKELTVYLIFFIFGSALMLLQAAGVKFPFIVDSVESFFKNVLHFKY